MKRLFDFTAALGGLILLSPLFLLISILIKSDSDGPIFYRQIRVGKGGRDFQLLKFRSMKCNSDEQGLLTVGDKDSRITKTGYYLRKYKLDELPQLINVLKGEMSFVGPRPEVRKYVDLYNAEQKTVLNVRPGITDIASIRYKNESEILKQSDDPEKFYIENIMPDKLSMNISYLKESSFFRDVKIIFQTLKAIVK